jgi:hypothetical protein
MRMYNRLVTGLAAVAALAIVAPVHAQQDFRVIARVPFAFAVGNTNLPRDTYRLSRMNGHPDMLLLRGERTGAFVRGNEERVPRDGAPPSLLFHRYGDQYFLRQIRWEGAARLDLPETKAERDAAEGRANRAAAVMTTIIIVAEQR